MTRNQAVCSKCSRRSINEACSGACTGVQCPENWTTCDDCPRFMMVPDDCSFIAEQAVSQESQP